MNVAIIGGGNFGTAIANIIARNGHITHLWMRDSEQVAQTLQAGENLRYLPGHPLEANVYPTADLGHAAQSSSLVFVAVPSVGFASVCQEMAPYISPDDVLISATKGIEPDGFRLMSQLLGDLTPSQHVGAISGPNLAEEIAEQQYAGTVIATHHQQDAVLVQEVMRNDTLRVYPSADVYGVELGGALKNIYAIVCGLAAGMEVGQNTIGLLVTRALAEMSRFAVSMGGNPFTFLGLAGVGDLLVTCTSPLSRNHQLGSCIAKGMTLDEASESLGKLAEGVNTLQLVYAKSRERDVYMPLVDGLYQILFEQKDIADVISTLMGNSEGADVEFVDPSRWQ
ncbi:MAG: NAD(P)H-dependent glycerol-3-phosphate dehydrogenase [Gammaproteobacteria bacterium]|jgi:glycerol-3-phosphate dehydrogenase (NAD(P)+)|nr:NAD(P)H-dependent glycerol-3-phosphate dehydrogenase [Gammaproteobacteria bacterium]